MTENKPIMIDGVDVSGCVYYVSTGVCTNQNIYPDYCSTCSNCRYKLEQQLDQLKSEKEQAEQKLEKIRQVCAETKDVGENIKDMYTAKLSGLYLKSRQILQIIDKAE